jgi:hypothetical protein
MSPDARRTNKTHDASRKQSQARESGVLSDLIRRLKASSSWQMLLALAMVLVAVAGLFQVSGLSSRLRPPPLPTGTPTPPPTWTALPTLTPTSTSLPTSTATPVPMVLPGGQAMVGGAGAQQLRLRAGPGLNHETLRILEDGTQLKILEGPESAGGHEWWKVQTEDGQEGWTAGDWLVPVVP